MSLKTHLPISHSDKNPKHLLQENRKSSTSAAGLSDQMAASRTFLFSRHGRRPAGYLTENASHRWEVSRFAPIRYHFRINYLPSSTSSSVGTPVKLRAWPVDQLSGFPHEMCAELDLYWGDSIKIQEDRTIFLWMAQIMYVRTLTSFLWWKWSDLYIYVKHGLTVRLWHLPLWRCPQKC